MNLTLVIVIGGNNIMAQYIDKDALAAEIERRKEKCDTFYNIALSNNAEFAKVAIEEQKRQHDGLLSFIDTLEVKEVQEEPVGEDLEEAAKHYLYSNILYDDFYVGNPTDKDCIEMFKAGANWQLNQIRKENE